MGKLNVELPEIIAEVFQDGITIEKLINKFDEDGACKGEITMKATVIVNGEPCLAYRAKEDIIWRPDGEFRSVSVRDVKVEGNFGIVRMGERDFIFEKGLEYLK
jgi:hypothetical protein